MESPIIKSELSRELNLFHITMMGLGMMIGAGVFLGIGNSIHIVGPGGAVLTFALNGLIAMFTAMSYAELSSAIPRAGGAYNFARIGFGKGTSFIAGWMEWFASSVAGSVYAHTFSIYTLRYFEGLGLLSWVPFSMHISVKIVSVIIAGVFLYINFKGAQETGKFGAFFTMGQTLFLIIIGITGVVVAIKDPIRLNNFKPFMPNGWIKILVTMGFTYVAFEGFEVISQAGDETIKPRKNLPKAMLLSVFIVIITYILVTFASIVSVKPGTPGVTEPIWKWIGGYRERGFGEAVSHLLPMGNILLTLAVIFASTSSLNATIYSASRVAYALGRDNMLPSFFSKISKKTQTPYIAIASTGTIILLIALFLPTVHIASSASIMFLFLFFLVNICVIKIRWNLSEELTYGYIMPLFPLFPIIAILAQLTLSVWLIHMSLVAWVIAPLWILIGFLIFNTYAKNHAKPSPHDIQILEEVEEKTEEEKFKIMVALSNPNSAIPMVRATYKICTTKNSHVELLHMVQVPEQVPLSDAHLYMLKGKEAIIEVMLYLSPILPVSSTIRYCRSISRGIITAVKEKKIDLLILGYPGNTGHHLLGFGGTIDTIIEKSPSDTLIFKNVSDKPYKKVIVFPGNGMNLYLSLEVASILMENGAEIDIVEYGKSKGLINIDKLKKIDENLNALIIEKGIKLNIIPISNFEDENLNTAIIRRSSKYDLVVLGLVRRQSKSQSFLNKELIDVINTPVVIVRASTKIHSLFGNIL